MAGKQWGYKFFLTVFIVFLSGMLFFSCSQPTGGGEEAPEESQDGLTYVKFVNNSRFDADVYLDNPRQDKIVFASVPSGNGDTRVKINPGSDAGTPFYIVYRFKIGSVTIPYFNTAYIKNQKIAEAMITPVVIPELTSSPTDSIYLVIQNETQDQIFLQQRDITLYAIGKQEEEEQKWIPGGEDGVYEFTVDQDKNGLNINHNTNLTALPAMPFEKGKIYSFRYDGKTAALLSIASFNPDTINKIWSIPTSTAAGKFFTVGFFAPRKNPGDGYVLTGNINYAKDTVVNDNIPRSSYLGLISQNGIVSAERTINVRDNPARMFFRSFLEDDSGEFVFLGSSYYRETEKEKVFLLSMNANGGAANYYYTDFVRDIDEDKQDLYNSAIVSSGTGKYGVGLSVWNRDENRSVMYIANVEKTAFDEVKHVKIWESPPQYDIDLGDMIYDASQNMYILSVFEYTTGSDDITGSIIFFIDASTGAQKFPPIIQNKFHFNKILKVDSDYYVGGFYNNASGNYEGILHMINPAAGTFVWNNPVRFPSLDNGMGSLSIKNLLEDNGKLILAGHTNADRINGYGYLPWLCAFNPDTKEKIWENVYDEFPDYEIYSAYSNGIGSYLIEIYNEISYESLLLSTDLMGKISGRQLDPVPRDPKQIAVAPSFTVTFDSKVMLTADASNPSYNPPPVTVEYGGTINPLPLPVDTYYDTHTQKYIFSIDEGYYCFEGWYYDDEDGQEVPFTEATQVKRDYGLWANWRYEPWSSY
jgi:hypothetical protein